MNTYRYVWKSITKRGMERILYLFPLLSILLLIYACDEKSIDSFPEIQLLAGHDFIASDTSVKAGSTMQFAIEAKADELTLTNFLVKVQTDCTLIYFDTGIYTNTLLWNGKFIKSTSPTEKWRFVIRDKLGNVNETIISINTDSAAAYLPVNELNDIQLGAQNSSVKGLFSLTGQYAYSFEEANDNSDIQKLIDILYYFGDDMQTISSPGANIEEGIFSDNIQNWQIKNTTRFHKLDINYEDFNNIENDSLLVSNYNEALAKRKAKNLGSGDIFIFRTQNNILGLFYVVQVSGKENGSILINLKFSANQ